MQIEGSTNVTADTAESCLTGYIFGAKYNRRSMCSEVADLAVELYEVNDYVVVKCIVLVVKPVGFKSNKIDCVFVVVAVLGEVFLNFVYLLFILATANFN